MQVDGSGKNFLGRAFVTAVAHCGARAASCGFDDTVIEIDKGDAGRFLESLHITMSGR